MTQQSSSTVRANGVDLAVEDFGRESDPLILLVGSTSMLAWPDQLCERLARADRRVVRYDLRDNGPSTTRDPDSPAYDLRDLAADAAALVAVLGHKTAHLAGAGVGGMVAQVAALDHASRFEALTLIGTRPVAPGSVDADLPDHDPVAMKAMFAVSEPDWSDRDEVVAAASAWASARGDDPTEAGVAATRIWDRTPTAEPAVHRANQLATVFARLDCAPRWRERLPDIAVPTLVVHGRNDVFFPPGNAEAIVAAIPDSRLLLLDPMASRIPEGKVDELATAMLVL